MELLGEEFGDMSPQQLAAPVNTVEVGNVWSDLMEHTARDYVGFFWNTDVKFTAAS